MQHFHYCDPIESTLSIHLEDNAGEIRPILFSNFLCGMPNLHRICEETKLLATRIVDWIRWVATHRCWVAGRITSLDWLIFERIEDCIWSGKQTRKAKSDQDWNWIFHQGLLMFTYLHWKSSIQNSTVPSWDQLKKRSWFHIKIWTYSFFIFVAIILRSILSSATSCGAVLLAFDIKELDGNSIFLITTLPRLSNLLFYSVTLFWTIHLPHSDLSSASPLFDKFAAKLPSSALGDSLAGHWQGQIQQRQQSIY